MNKLHRFVMIMIASVLVVSIGSCQNELDESGDTDPLPDDVIEEYIADGFVPVDWGQAELEEFDKETGKVVMAMAEEDIPAFEAGSSMLVDNGSETYIRRVTGVEVDGGRVTLETVQGDMSDIFRNVAFELSGELTGRLMSRGGDGRYQFYPEEIRTKDAGGRQQTWLASRAGDSFLGEYVYEQSIDYSGTVMFELDATTVGFEDCHLNMNLCPSLYLDFGEREVKDSTAVEKVLKKGRLRDFGCSFEGTADWALVPEVFYGHEVSVANTKTLKDVFPELSMRFVVFGVPVWVTIGTDIVAEMSGEANAAVSVTGGAKGVLNGKLGFNVHDIGGSSSFEPVSELKEERAEPVPLTVSAEGCVESALYLYPQLRVKLYSVLGPTVALGNGLEAKCGLGMQNEAMMRYAELDYFTKLRCSLDYKILWMENNIGGKKEWTLDSLNLYKEPASLEFVPSEGKSVNVGDKINATFRVNAMWQEEEHRPAGEGYYVYCEAENVSEPWSVTDENGEVTVEWTPKSVDEKLIAVVYGEDFEEVARDTADIVVNGKKIKRMVRRNGSTILHEYDFQYDEQGRLSRITAYGHDSYEGKIDYTTFAYADDHVAVDELYCDAGVQESHTVIIHLDENGRATRSDVSHDDYYVYSYDAGGYLSEIEESYGVNRLTVVNGNLISVNRCGGDGDWDWISELTYGDAPNNTNIDLFYFVCFGDLLNERQAMYLGLTGRRFKDLPTGITNADSNSNSNSANEFSYVVNDEGNVICIIEDLDEYSLSWDIYYEE